MDELYALEREEAMRRAEYEARHAEALRRAEYEARNAGMIYFRGRTSKSATTSPVPTPYHSGLPLKSAGTDGASFGVSGITDWPEGDDSGRHLDKASQAKRRMSGPAWQMTGMTQDVRPGQQLPGFASSSAAGPEASGGRITLGPDPPNLLQPPHPPAYPHLVTHEDSPSPLSSDSDSIQPHHPHQHPSHASFVRPCATYPPPGTSVELSPQGTSTVKPEFTFTPSASPFLGPLRTLNLHSANPSRAPSPISLPPARAHNQNDAPVSPVEGHSIRQRSRGSSHVGSPPSFRGIFSPSSRKKSSSDVPQMAALPHVHSYPGHLSLAGQADRNHSLPTPQLSSGPSSSSGSSPGSFTYPLGSGVYSTRPTFETGPMTQSPPSSRPASPPHGGNGLPHPASNGHHLAYSVRLAFAMTPIKSSGPPRNTSWPNPQAMKVNGLPSATATSNIFSCSSVPASRAGSPPITLPPLKLNSTPNSPGDDEDMSSSDDEGTFIAEKKARKIELPGFKEFEAATRNTR
ncbi:hypothetical protein PAXRUDRAFT_146148 [Paxillus rubicundulus Ve08.2h10]|uniref:Uncharacterized protein n=1 Tax=Paxillus rubicundulus Ve08.2h10 TaxID=930991 RepID=A0A0D0DUU1_9AGAM|nr:hypothetical protein PAXRUDRAFT_146148 [Paxillus rubicundulus Ve08.2h10]